MCCGKEHNLNIHHLNYYGKYPWDVNDNDLICLCKDCHNKVHSGELTNLNLMIDTFNSLSEDKDRVMCFKNNNYIGNYSLLEAEEKFSLNKKRIIKCCDGETSSCGGYNWKYPKLNQKIECYEPYTSPSGTVNYIDFTLGKYSDHNLLTNTLKEKVISDWEYKFICSLYETKTLTMKQKITLIDIVKKLENKRS